MTAPDETDRRAALATPPAGHHLARTTGAAASALGLGVRLAATLLLSLWFSSCVSYTQTRNNDRHLGLVASNAARVEIRPDGTLVIDALDQGTPSREALKIWGLLNIGRSLVSAADNAAQDALSTASD